MHKQIGYRADIDGLRAIAVFAVIIFHAFPSFLVSGYMGVDVFFVISGYLITTIIRTEVQAGTFSLAAFYARRIRRIFPALIIVLAAVWMCGWLILYSDEFYRLAQDLLSASLFYSNFEFLSSAGYFDVSAEAKPLLHLWSLGIEEQFYLFWPLLLVACLKARRPFVLTGSIFAVSLTLCIILTKRDQALAFYLPFTRFWELMAGALLALRSSNRSHQWCSIGAACGLSLILASFVLPFPQSRFPGAIAILPVVGTALAISCGPGSITSRLLASPPFVGLGLISYPLYLWHWPVLSLMRIWAGEPLSLGATAALLGVSVILACGTMAIVERRARIASRAMIVLPAGMFILAALAIVVIVGDGFPERRANAYATLMRDARPKVPLASDGSCQDVLGDSIANEVCLRNSTSPTVLFMGDSHAMRLAEPTLDAAANKRTMLVAGSSCLPFVGYTMHGPEGERARNCPVIARNAILAARAESIKTVVLPQWGQFISPAARLRSKHPRISIFIKMARPSLIGSRLLSMGIYIRLRSWKRSASELYSLLTCPNCHSTHRIV